MHEVQAFESHDGHRADDDEEWKTRHSSLSLVNTGDQVTVGSDVLAIDTTAAYPDDATDADRVAYLLGKLDDIPARDRTARFRCVIAVAWPGGPLDLHTGACEGRILEAPRGSGGFGYDPVFFLPALGKSMAELTMEQKNRVSHRSAAAWMASASLSRPDELGRDSTGPT